jgi:hypothetical protein
MKKILFLVTVCILATVTTFAQRSIQMPKIAGDTVVDAGSVTQKSFSVTGSYSAAAVQIVLTKISGTVAGTTKIQGSLNGTNWEDIGTAFTNTDVASQAKLFTITGGVPYTSIRVNSTGSGTMKALLTVYYVLKTH